jgi:putative methionine-R-sulfoxide reductase with GAF domain
MTDNKSVPTQVVRPLSGSIKSQVVFILLGMVFLAMLGMAWLAINSIEGLGKSTLDIGKMAAIDQAVMDELQEALDLTLRQFVFWKIIPLGILVIGVAFGIGTIWSNRLVKPLNQLVENTKAVQAEALPSVFPLEAPGEIGILAAQQAELAQRLNFHRQKQQEQAETLAEALAKRTNQLMAAAHLVREATTIQQPEHWMERAVNLVGDRFGFYHVAIFLIDPGGQYAVLRAATGEVGNKMMTMGQRLRIGQTSVVGYVASTGRVYTVHDVETEPIYLRTPLLSGIRSEVALPLRVNQRTIGVLDIQSNQAENFVEDDIQALQTLADQISVTIDKMFWYQEYQETLARLQRARGENQPGGSHLVQPTPRIDGFIYDLTGVKAITTGSKPLTEEMTTAGAPIHLPLTVRGEVVATLDVWPDKENLSIREQNFLDDLGERLSQAIESAQLFEETQVRVKREQIYNRFTTNLSRSLDLEALLQQAVRELGQMPDVKEVSIVVSRPVELSEDSTGKPK